MLEEAPFLEVKLESRISLKIENRFEMWPCYIHLTVCDMSILRDSSNPDHYTVHSFLVNQSGKLLIVTISETILPRFNGKVWHAETYCSTLSHSWCHTYKLHYFILFFFSSSTFGVSRCGIWSTGALYIDRKPLRSSCSGSSFKRKKQHLWHDKSHSEGKTRRKKEGREKESSCSSHKETKIQLIRELAQAVITLSYMVFHTALNQGRIRCEKGMVN